MLKTILLSAAVALLSSTAMAADLIIEDPVAVPEIASAYDWSGFYLGVHGGYGTGDVTVTPLDDGRGESSASGWLLGVQAGANAQYDAFVLGVEGDVAWSNINNTDDTDAGPWEGNVEVDWLASLRGRAGVSFDQVLLYATAGVASSGVHYTDLDIGPGADGSAAHFGWTAGVGVEVAVTEDISAKVEYLYYDFGAETYDIGTPDDVSFNLHTIKAGLNFHF